MEELQDAIEDAQYVNAIATQEEGPRPVLSWEIPTEEQLAEWENRVRLGSNPAGTPSDIINVVPFSCDWYLMSAIGLFLFSAYLKEECSDYLRINFLEEVIRWHKLRGKHRFERAKKIAEVYLKRLPMDEVTGQRVFPEKTEIDEYDLSRVPPKTMAQMSDTEFQMLYSISWDTKKEANCLGLQGTAVEEILTTLQTVEKNLLSNSRRSAPGLQSNNSTSLHNNHVAAEEPKEQSSSAAALAAATAEDSSVTSTNTPTHSTATPPHSQHGMVSRKQMEKFSSLRELTQSYRDKSFGDSSLPESLFDKVDALVVESLRREHWEGFLQSEQYTRLRNFLWFQDRRIVPEDFFTMRVLGRGGFGSVTGTLWDMRLN